VFWTSLAPFFLTFDYIRKSRTCSFLDHVVTRKLHNDFPSRLSCSQVRSFHWRLSGIFSPLLVLLGSLEKFSPPISFRAKTLVQSLSRQSIPSPWSRNPLFHPCNTPRRLPFLPPFFFSFHPQGSSPSPLTGCLLALPEWAEDLLQSLKTSNLPFRWEGAKAFLDISPSVWAVFHV